MSVEGLLSEVFATWNTRLTIKAADQAFFGGKQVYTNVPLTATTCDGGNKSEDKLGGHDELGTAIKNAQNVIDKALAGQSVGGGNDQKVYSEIAALKKENQEIKKEVAELRKLIEKLSVNTSSRLLFGDSQRVLVLGDGNLSFSLSLARLFPNKPIAATVLEDESAFVKTYVEGKTNIAKLRQLRNVELRFSTDATDLPSTLNGDGHDAVIMNFPHPGGKTNLKKSRQLTRGVFRSLRQRTLPSVEFNLSLAVGQSGIPYDASMWSDEPPDHRSDSWQVLQIASEEGWQLQEILPMVPWLFPGYKSSGYKSTTKGFNNYTAAQRLVFRKYEKTKDFDYLRDCDRPEDMFCTLRPFFIRDISFLFTCEEIDKNQAPVAAAPVAAKDADDDFDLFGSEDEEEDSEEKKKIVEERLKAYNEKKSAKPGPIAKSSVILDVKPWDDETDLAEMERLVRGIEMDGLVWGGAKLIAIGYGIKKLQIICVIEDLKVSVDDLIEKITGDFEDHVQSVDIAAFNKI